VRTIGKLSLVASLALVALALTASLASAKVVWSAPEAYWKGSLTLKRGGANATTCTFGSGVAGTVTSEAHFEAVPNGWGWEVPCGSKPTTNMVWEPVGEAESDGKGGFRLNWYDPHLTAVQSAWSGIGWSPGGANVPFVNAVGATPSHITFSETVIGIASGGYVTATGTLNVVDWSGKSVTLSVK